MGKRYRDPFDTCHGLVFDDSMSDESGIDIPASSSSKKLRLHDFSASANHSFKQSINQSVSQPNFQSSDDDLLDVDPHMGSMDCTDLEGHPLDSDSDQSVDQTVNYSNNQSPNQRKQTHNGLSANMLSQTNNPLTKQPTIQSISQPIKRPTNQYSYLAMTEAEYDARSLLSLEPTDMIRQWLERDSPTNAPMEHCYQ